MVLGLAVNNMLGLDEFKYHNGYEFTATDLGSEGVRIELVHPSQGTSAVIMPPDKARRCAHWILRSLALREPNLPSELPELLYRLVNNKTLRRGDKKKIREAIQILRLWQSD